MTAQFLDFQNNTKYTSHDWLKEACVVVNLAWYVSFIIIMG